MFQVIQKMTHHICTVFGDSTQSSAMDLIPQDVTILQGNGAAGMAWTAVSLVMFAAMKSVGYRYQTRTAITGEILCLLGFAFVDDADIIHSGSSNTTPGRQVLLDIQTVLDLWDGLLQAPGGALRKNKSYWYLLDYDYQHGQWVIKPQSTTPGDISLYNDLTHQKEPIECLHPTEARKALGIYTTPLGNMHAEKLYL